MKAFLRAFAYAASGVSRAVRQERNFRFHLCVAAYVYLFSLFYLLSALEYVALTVLVAGVLALELVNSAIERVVDKLMPEPNPAAGAAKDLAAGAVLVFSIAAAACGVWLFGDIETLGAVVHWFTMRPLALIPLAASLAASVWFVFLFGRKRKNEEKRDG